MRRATNATPRTFQAAPCSSPVLSMYGIDEDEDADEKTSRAHGIEAHMLDAGQLAALESFGAHGAVGCVGVCVCSEPVG